MDHQFGGAGGDGDFEQGFQKRGRFDDPPPPPADELDDVPPATLRILVRQIDAGGIIGKVCMSLKYTFKLMKLIFSCREEKISRDLEKWYKKIRSCIFFDSMVLEYQLLTIMYAHLPCMTA